MKRLSRRIVWSFWLGLPVVTWLFATPILTAAFVRYGVKTQVDSEHEIIFYGTPGKMPKWN